MEPAAHEYFHTFEVLKNQISAFKNEQKQLRLHISRLFEENKKLSTELKENLQIRSESDIGTLEQQLQAALSAKDAAIEMWQAALKEINKQEELLMGKRSLVRTERDEVEKQIQRVKDEYNKSLNILSEELSSYRLDLTRCKTSLDEKNTELNALTKRFSDLREEMNNSQKVRNDLARENEQFNAKINSLQTMLLEAERLLEDSRKEMNSIKSQNWELSIAVTETKEQNKKLKFENVDLAKEAKESLLTAQEAVLQKKEFAYREELFVKEIERLKSATNMEVEKVGQKFKAEIKEMQKEMSEKVQSLMEEIENLHRVNSEKQGMFEKTLREKQTLESKVESMHSEYASGIPFSGGTLEDLCGRLTMAEKARHEFELKYCSLETTLHEVKQVKEQEIQCLREERKVTEERLKSLLKDFNSTSADRVRLCDEVSKLRKRASELEKELKLTKAKHSNEISAMSENFGRKHQDLVERAQQTEEHHKKACSEMQKLLDAEFKISSQLKAETDTVISKSEFKIQELCQNIMFLKHQNEQLVNMLQANDIYIPSNNLFTP